MQLQLLRQERGSFFGDCLAERRVELCEAARVILLYNLDLEAEGPLKLCNGSLGVVGPMPSAEEVAAAVDQKVSELESAEAQASEQAQAARAPQDQGLERIHYYKIYRSRLRQWVTADRSRGDDVGRDGGCCARPSKQRPALTRTSSVTIIKARDLDDRTIRKAARDLKVHYSTGLAKGKLHFTRAT